MAEVTRNAADDLRREIRYRVPLTHEYLEGLLDAALREQTRITVDEIADRLPAGFDVLHDDIESAVVWRHDVTVILDEVAALPRTPGEDRP